MMTRERFAETNWKMSYEEFQKCDCTECKRENCIHREHIEEFLKLMVDLGYVLI